MLKGFAEITHGFVGADLSALTKEAAMTLLRRIYPDLKLEEDQPIPREALEKLVVAKRDFIEALKVVRPSAMREVLIEVPNVSWEDVGGMENIKQELEEAIEWPLKHPDVFKKMITHRYKLSDANKALKAVSAKETLKAVLLPQEG